jgi:hypothetical protein
MVAGAASGWVEFVIEVLPEIEGAPVGAGKKLAGSLARKE